MKWVFFGFLLAYLAAMALFAIGTFGLFGSDSGPLAGIFLIPLGWPWNWIGDQLGLASVLLGLLAPAINLGLLFWLWKH